ncbi:parkin coregulated gene protein homolog [Condylostylus longicornis]|uniref:parkin coregulated gene protein homolog n=1 Tax=Condylostylus longicornis TaxID=2530218 RepID=UPI00244DE5BF|nr:parkin coregulated gene protein homolog [Condylostylus longicornis]
MEVSSISDREFYKKCGCGNRKDLANFRIVPPFSYQSIQKATIVYPPPKSYPKRKKPTRTTLFRFYFKRGDVPLCSSILLSTSKYPNGKRLPVQWFCDPNKLDYFYYLPILMDGLGESDKDLRELAFNATYDLLLRNPKKILAIIPQLILPLKRALNTKDPPIVVGVLKIIQKMVLLDPSIARALVPFFRTLLPVCNLFKDDNANIGIEVDTQRDNRLGDVIDDTLQILERSGGPDAYINIKYMVPTYESSVAN